MIDRSVVKEKKNIVETPVTALVHRSQETAISRSNFYPFGPRPLGRRTRIRWQREASRKGRWWLFAGGNFSEKRASDTWPAYERQRWLRKWCVLWFYNTNGWPKRGSQDEAVTHGRPCVYPLFPDHAYMCMRTVYGKRGWPLFDCPLRNWVMSRHVDRVYSPIKSISGFRGTPLFISTPSYIIFEASSSLTHHHSCFSVITSPRSTKSLIYCRSLTFRGIIHREHVSVFFVRLEKNRGA